MRIENIPFQTATKLVLTNDAGMKVELTNYAASLYQVYLEDRPLMIAYAPLDTFVSQKAYHGKTIAPICGRIKGADLFFDGKHYPLEANEGKNTLHSGPCGSAWQYFAYSFIEVEEGIKVLFTLNSKEEEDGFPGNRHYEVEYLIYEKENRIRLTFRITSDIDSPVSVTNHGYWNLGGYLSIKEHTLMIKANKVRRYDKELIPLDYVSVKGPLDFRKPKRLKKALDAPSLIKLANKGIDHAFLFDKHEEDESVLIYEGPKVKMEVATSYPAVVIYGDNEDKPNIPLNNGAIHHRHMGLAIEPQYEANDYETMRVKEGVTKVEFIDYRFSIK